jgi:hypothetical protein
MAFTGAGLAIAWLGQWAAFIFSGKVPSIGEGPFALVAALDLSLMVPFFLTGAVLLWRRRPWGFLLGAVMTVKGATYTLILAVNSALSAREGLVEGAAAQVPIWSAWCLASVAAATALLWGARRDPGGDAVA